MLRRKLVGSGDGATNGRAASSRPGLSTDQLSYCGIQPRVMVCFGTRLPTVGQRMDLALPIRDREPEQNESEESGTPPSQFKTINNTEQTAYVDEQQKSSPVDPRSRMWPVVFLTRASWGTSSLAAVFVERLGERIWLTVITLSASDRSARASPYRASSRQEFSVRL